MFFSLRRTLFLVGVALSMVFPVVAAPSIRSDDKRIAQWITELSHDDFAVREKASHQLWLAGESAETALEKTLQSGDPEAVRRARAILDKFQWGIYADTPAEVVALIRAYQARENVNDEAVGKLLDADVAGFRAILLIARNDTNAKRVAFFRELVSRRMLGHLQKVFDRIEDKTRWDRFITLAHEGAVLADRHFAAYWLLRGQLDDRIRECRARLDRNAADKRAAHSLVYLYQTRGDLAEARTLAEKAKFDDLLAGILLKMGDWKALAARSKPLGLYPIDHASYRASFARLSGDQKQWETATADLNKLGHGQDAYKAGLAFLANGRPSEGINLLSSRGDNRRFAFLVLCDRLQYREAMALVEQTPADADDRAELEIELASTWYDLGEPDKGKALLVRLGGRLAEERNSYWPLQLLRTEHRIGVNDLALEHCARLLPVPQAERGRAPRDVDYLSAIYGGQGDYPYWYPFLRRKFPKDSTLRSLQRLRDLFDGKIAKTTVKEWIEEGQKELGSLKKEEKSERLIAFAEVALAAGMDAWARSLLEQADTHSSWFRLGELLAGKKEWLQAAECYRRAWRKHLRVENWLAPERGVHVLPLYLAGDALVKAGREREGNRLIEQAHFAPLGDGGSRYSFFDELRERGHREAARRELSLTARLAEASPRYAFSYFTLASRELARASAARKDHFQAAKSYEQALFSDLRMVQVHFGLIGAMRMASQIHRLRACGLLADDKQEEAKREIELALLAWPANTYVAIALVPELERRGRKKEADALFARCLEPHEKTCRAYPRCAESHNNVAWTSVCCHRNLDKALQHAQKAVEFMPANANHHDTLAEVHFQRGDKEKAIAAEKRAIELEPKKPYYQKQLKRMQSGDPSVERPPET